MTKAKKIQSVFRVSYDAITGKWRIRKVPFNPHRYDTHRTRAAAQSYIDSKLAQQEEKYLQSRRDFSRNRLVEALNAATLEDLSEVRDLFVRLFRLAPVSQ